MTPTIAIIMKSLFLPFSQDLFMWVTPMPSGQGISGIVQLAYVEPFRKHSSMFMV